jgi:hypothetical protein
MRPLKRLISNFNRIIRKIQVQDIYGQGKVNIKISNYVYFSEVFLMNGTLLS